MDHVDFRGSVFTTPVVGKSVTQITQVTEVARHDDKMYVVMRANFYYDGEDTFPLGVAMSLDKANNFVRTYNIKGAILTAHEEGTDGTWYRHFDVQEPGDVESVAVYIDVTDVI